MVEWDFLEDRNRGMVSGVGQTRVRERKPEEGGIGEIESREKAKTCGEKRKVRKDGGIGETPSA